MKNSIMVSLLGVVNTEKDTSTNYIIAHYIIKHWFELRKFSTSDLANACHVSKSSISRFCRSIGLEDFLELKSLLRVYDNPIDKKFIVKNKTGDFIIDYLDDIKEKIENSKQIISHHDLIEIAKEIHDNENVYVFGHMQSNNIAYNLQHDLISLQKFIYCTQDKQIQKEILLNDKDGMILVFSASGSFFNTLLSGRIFNKSIHKKVYLITAKDIIEKPPYIYKIIKFDSNDTYSSNILMHIYANLIAIEYKKIIECSTL